MGGNSETRSLSMRMLRNPARPKATRRSRAIRSSTDMRRSMPSGRLGDLRAAARIITSLSATGQLTDEQKRLMVADLCRLIESRLKLSGFDKPLPTPQSVPLIGKLSPRMLQTLQQLLRGDSEKQAARALGVSPHTVHVYVKAIYRKFGVASRGELLAKFVTAGVGQ